jgi:uncharacterized protein
LKDHIKKADTVAAFFEATELAGFSIAEAQKFFGLPRGITRDMFDITPLPSTEAQSLFVKRFEAIEALRAGKTGDVT